MFNVITASTVLVSFFVTLYLLPKWIKKAHFAGLEGKDVHKQDQHLVAEVGGICVIAGFIAGLLAYIATRTFIFKGGVGYIDLVLATLVSVMIALVIGVLDDILGWKIGLSRRSKILLTFAIPIPIMVINAGVSKITLPLLGHVELGLVFPLVLVPLAIIGTANAFNMLAGYNGLEALQGIVILSTLGLISYLSGSSFAAVIAFCMVVSLLAFLLFNYYPSMLFPGDSMTYSVGALIGIVAILGNIEKYALIMFIPYFFEFVLKARGKMQKESFADRNVDGSLRNRYDKFYGLEHVAIALLSKLRIKPYEWRVVWSIVSVEILLAGLALFYFYLHTSPSFF
ncbi:glycosyl transferase family 4 [Candidatus Woesearchaeota archaeon]|jgi:UDP-N-acetylglucosamine--dolichyl-phosphate N-acetylglucosaminephosphotransferase|nr:glycosyl transferase family 4 [Candidatus Woesearchaeota archaeon]MBT3537587.1 glycosyl transferase family 4 [Candidatus Woesearchaeota archaeon]MBT4696911.1 glycosyl transferase family 4 [Candidatus Woesearchaeota archaeon]MBT4716431.1 glycosyl transferase family 4 [Candidatus Woesearchaeota archaeon]MBT7105256.1 glycosyl transferase family 4 [Candidatus Woesearchaeota archaeon]